MGALALGCAVLYSFPPQEYGFYPRCPFYAATHLLCPGCGGTRALYQLLHFHFFAALRLNALVTIAAPLLVAWFIFWYYSIMRYGQAPQVKLRPSALAGLYVVVFLFAVLRNTSLF
jgi:hypothetical protein